ncbi:hypothetical protein GGE46_002275 [Rhizobium etli]|uniref:Ornithine cyclodeaminase n=1 Tax=Rhizobium etli TaxID=29449 RepID=A0A7W6V8Q1_RHIET|nr:hypothetical protein [Rhizobium etli]MBB4535071.1 hypothetical protein [Rhizobium etli]
MLAFDEEQTRAALAWPELAIADMSGDCVMVRQAIPRASVYVDTRRRQRGGRSGETEITLLKSVGAALEDLAGAILAYERVTGRK